MTPEYDVAVIGGGPGGYVAAIRASQLGLRVAVVERESLGGVCLNWGCIPTKSLLRSAEVLETVRRSGEFGCRVTGEIVPDYSEAWSRSRSVSEGLVCGVEGLMRKSGIAVYRDTAHVEELGILSLMESRRYIRYEKLIVAAGGSPAGIPGLVPDGRNILTPRQALERQELPPRICIIGAGPIGIEFAFLWSVFGAEVTVIELRERVLPLEDVRVGAEIADSFTARGIKLRPFTRVDSVERRPDGVTVSFTAAGNGTERDPTDTGYARGDTHTNITDSISVDMVLTAAGIRPNSRGLGLERIGVRLDERGYIPVGPTMETSVPGVFAVGDITGRLALAHTASAQGVVAAEAAAGLRTEELDYARIPRCIYCAPEAASAGLAEDAARARPGTVRTGEFPLAANGKARALGETKGFVKIVSDGETDEVLGVHMVGAHVTEIIGGAAQAMRLECTTDEFIRAVMPHPSIGEVLTEAALEVRGWSLHI